MPGTNSITVSDILLLHPFQILFESSLFQAITPSAKYLGQIFYVYVGDGGGGSVTGVSGVQGVWGGGGIRLSSTFIYCSTSHDLAYFECKRLVLMDTGNRMGIRF